MNIVFLAKHQFWHNETTRYWFGVDGDEYAISDCNGDLNLLDCNGEQLKLDGRNLKIFEQLSELYLNEV